jgi:hypothetical protein
MQCECESSKNGTKIITIAVFVYHLIDVGRGRGGVRMEFLSLRVQRYSVCTHHRVGRVLSVSPVVGIGTPPPL